MANTNYQFHYVYNATGQISGRSVLQQTEDAINDLGGSVSEGVANAAEALRLAQLAEDTADTAQQNAASALSTAQSALTRVTSLETVVDGYSAQIESAVADASQAVSTAQSASSVAAQALESAQAAEVSASQAETKAAAAESSAASAQTISAEAKSAATEAKETAEQAKIDADADIATMSQLLEDTQNASAQAASSASSAGTAAGEAQDASDLAERWATWMGGTSEDGEALDPTVDGSEYSSKYYAQQAKASADSAKAQATAAAQSATEAAASASSAAQDAETATAKATEATTAASSATTAKTAAETAQTAAEAAQEAAEEAAASLTDTRFILALIASQSTWYRRPSLPTSAKTTITIPAGTQVNISGSGYIATTAQTLQVSTVGSASARAGKDVYIYACQPESGTEPVFVLSLNSTVPSGYTASNSRKIGGFHCLCVSAGTIANCEASGYSQGDIIPPSIWDLLHRAQSENEGMSYVDELNLWVDIYLPSWSGSKLQSVYGGEIIDGYSTMPMHGERFVEYSGYVKKHLLSRDQFMVIADSGNQMTNIQGSADPGTTGGHKDTANRRIITNDFIEDCAGVLWQWTSDIYGKANLATSATTYNYNCASTVNQTETAEGNHWWDGCGWQTDGRSTANINVDGAQHVKGDSYGVLARARVGARWGDGSPCGSRSVLVHNLSSRRDASISARLGSSPRVVSL